MKRLLQVVFVLAVIGILLAIIVPTGTRCGIATIYVSTGSETQSIQVGLDSYDFFGRKVESNDLIRLVEKRIKKIAGSPKTEEWRTTPYKKAYYKIDRAIDILIKIRHPEVRRLCEALLRDSYFCHRAVDYLAEIGGPESATAILYVWIHDQKYPFVYINAFIKLKDPRAIPCIINSIGPQYQDVESKVTAIEKISGESLSKYVNRAAHFQSSTDDLKMNLWTWWVDYKKKKNIVSI